MCLHFPVVVAVILKESFFCYMLEIRNTFKETKCDIKCVMLKKAEEESSLSHSSRCTDALT